MHPERWRQIEELYHQARELDPAARRGFLKEACAGDEQLWRELESLLEKDATGAGFLEQPAGELAADWTRTAVTPGMQLGPYRIESRLGKGGMGEVFRAVDTRLDRRVAVKVCSGVFEGRFTREARAIAALNHSHICTLYDVGANYLVMELVEGETLSD